LTPEDGINSEVKRDITFKKKNIFHGKLYKCKPQISLFLFIAWMSLTINCATVTSPVVVESGLSSNISLAFLTDHVIFFLPPDISYEDTYTQRPISPTQAHKATAIELIRSKALQWLRANKASILTLEDFSDDVRSCMKELLRGFQANYHLFLSSNRDKKKVLPVLHELQSISQATAFCIVLTKVKVGQPATTELPFGDLRQSASSSTVKVIIASLNDGENLWAREGFVRCLPKKRRFSRLLDLILKRR